MTILYMKEENTKTLIKETVKSLKAKIKKYNDKENTTEDEDNQATVWKGQIIKILLDLRNKIPESIPDKDFDIISKKIGNTIFTEEELNTELKKYKTTPITTKSKKTIEVGENGRLTPLGFTKEEKDLVRKIDGDLYKHETIIVMIKKIGQGKITSSDEFPEPDIKKTKGGKF